MATHPVITSGKLLVAEPFMIDPYFRRAVVLLCEHNEEGSVGFILNKKTEMKVTDLIPTFPEFDAEIFYGGPVQTDTLHYVHNVGTMLEDSIKLTDGVYWGGDFESLQFLITSGLIEPHNIRFFVGYSGWSAGQLDEEMETGSWVTADMHANYLFKTKPDGLWSEVMYNKGNRFEIIADIPEHVSLN